MTDENQKNQEPSSGVENNSVPSQEGSDDKAMEVEVAPTDNTCALPGLYCKKIGMTSVYNSEGINVPVTVLKYDPMFVSQVKTEKKEGYSAVQVAFSPKKASRSKKSECGHLKAAGFANGAYFKRELPNNKEMPVVGQRVSIESLKKGDRVKVTGKSKGRGFAGTVKRYNFAGGPASHGSKFHRQPGSVGNRTWPGMVIPGKKMPGHFGDEVVSVPNVIVVDVLADESVVLVKGPVPGGRHSLVRLLKQVENK